ncbi:hypothetical protein DFJ73DRAFT_964382 [Zopfochytrium polystomum]|nr:hypothetical protein DFJ73DRAFT_964382 [Zopfochytrium polystomum]
MLLEWWRNDSNPAIAIAAASRNGHVGVLAWLKSSRWPVSMLARTLSIVQAALAGHVAVLDWWNCSCADSVIASHDLRAALEIASHAGHSAVLDWLYSHSYFTQEAVLKSTRKALVSAAAAGHINVLEWWTRHGARRRDFRNCLVAAAKQGHIAVLDWCWNKNIRWRDANFGDLLRASRLRLAVLQWVCEHAAHRTSSASVFVGLLPFEDSGDLDVLQWGKRQFHQTWTLTPEILDCLCTWDIDFDQLISLFDNASDAPDYWTNRHLRIAARAGRLGPFKWWLQHVAPRKKRPAFQNDAVNGATANGHVHLLQWMKDTGLPIHHSPSGFSTLCENLELSASRKIAVLEWWTTQSGLPLRFYFEGSGRDVIALSADQKDLLVWWDRSGLVDAWPQHIAFDVLPYRGAAVVDAWQWWQDRATAAPLSVALEWIASSMNERDVHTVGVIMLEWWRKNGLYDEVKKFEKRWGVPAGAWLEPRRFAFSHV